MGWEREIKKDANGYVYSNKLVWKDDTADISSVRSAASSQAKDAVSTANSGLDVVRAAQGQVDSYLTNSRNLTGQAAALAGKAASTAAGANSTAAGATKYANEAANLANGASAKATDAYNLANNAKQDSASMRTFAPMISNAGQDMLGTASNIAAIAPTIKGLADQLAGRTSIYDLLGSNITQTATELNPFIEQLAGIGSSLFGQGSEMVNRANGILDIGQGLLNLDANSSELAGQWRRLYDAVSPETQAARAGSDVQANFDSARAQQQRAIARSGGSVTSGNALSQLKKQYLQILATAKSAAMTRGYSLGLDKQAEYLKTITDTANQLLGTGTTMFGAGTSSEAQGANATNAAAGMKVNQGQLLGTAAEVYGRGDTALNAAGNQYKNAADVSASSANAQYQASQVLKMASDLYGSAASIDINASSAMTGAANAQTSAANAKTSAANAQTSAANAMTGAASAMTGAANAQTSAANANTQAANVYNSYLNTLESAYGDLARTQTNAANTYVNIANTRGGVVSAGDRDLRV